MKRLLVLLLALALLTGVACAEGLKPRRDAVEPPAEEAPESPDAPAGLRPRRDGAAHEAHHEARHDARWSDLPGEEALQDAETIEGSFTIDKNGVKMLYDLTLSVALEEGETLPEAMDLLEFADYALNWVASGPINIVEVTATPANGEGVALTAHVEIRQGLGRKLLMLFTGQMDDWEPANILSGTLTLHDASSGEDVLPRYLFPAKRRPPCAPR